MGTLAKDLRLANLLVRSVLLLQLWSGVSCRDSLYGGRKSLEGASTPTLQNDVERMFSIPSSICRIVHQEGNTEYCYGALVASTWLLTPSSCAPKDIRLSSDNVRVVCGRPSSSPAFTQKEFNVIEVHPLRSATTGERQEPDMSLLQLDTDAPGPFVILEESDGPDFYILQQTKLMRSFFNDSDMGMTQEQDSRRNSNIDPIGLPLIVNSSAMNNGDASENSLYRITTCCLSTGCQLYRDGVKRCTFRRITPLGHKSICLVTGTCNEVPSASRMPPSFHRSLSASSVEETCLDSPRPILLAERHLIPPFAPAPFCSAELKTQLQNMTKHQMMSRLKHQVEFDDPQGVNKSLTCSTFNINALDEHNETFLHDAAWHNANKSTKVLCELGIDTEFKNKQGKTALLVASNRTSLETLKVLLNYNVDVNAADNRGRTALHFSASHNASKIAEILCEREQIDLEAQDSKGRTALIVATQRKSLDTLKVITNHNANVNAQDNRKRTALYYTVKNCDTKMAEFLKENKADPSIEDDKGKSALDLISKPSNACDRRTRKQLRSILSTSAIKQL